MTKDERIERVTRAIEDARAAIYTTVPRGHKNSIARRLLRAARKIALEGIRRGQP